MGKMNRHIKRKRGLSKGRAKLFPQQGRNMICARVICNLEYVFLTVGDGDICLGR